MSSNTPHPSTETFRSRFNRVLAVIFWTIMAALVVAGSFATGSVSLLAVVGAALVALAVWVLLWRPHLSVDDDGVTVVNVERTIRIPWAALVHIDTKYALTLYVPGRSIAVWAAPAPGRSVATRRARGAGSVRGLPVDAQGRARPGDLPNTDSGEAAAMVRGRWAAELAAGRVETGVADAVPLATTWHLLSLVGVAALAVALITLSALGR